MSEILDEARAVLNALDDEGHSLVIENSYYQTPQSSPTRPLSPTSPLTPLSTDEPSDERPTTSTAQQNLPETTSRSRLRSGGAPLFGPLPDKKRAPRRKQTTVTEPTTEPSSSHQPLTHNTQPTITPPTTTMSHLGTGQGAGTTGGQGGGAGGAGGQGGTGGSGGGQGPNPPAATGQNAAVGLAGLALWMLKFAVCIVVPFWM